MNAPVLGRDGSLPQGDANRPSPAGATAWTARAITMPLTTPLLAAAQQKGCRTQNGQQMFDAQVDFICDFLLGKD